MLCAFLAYALQERPEVLMFAMVQAVSLLEPTSDTKQASRQTRIYKSNDMTD